MIFFEFLPSSLSEAWILVTKLFRSVAGTDAGGIIGSRGGLSLTSFKLIVRDTGALAAVPFFSLATIWNLNFPGLGGSLSRLFSLTVK